MKSIKITSLVAILAVTAFGLSHLTACSSASVKEAHLAAHSEKILKNGLHILTVENHSLPYVSVGLLVRSGSADDPLTKSGLSSLTASLLERGSKAHSAAEIADQFAQLGTDFSSRSGEDYLYFSSAALSKDQDELLNLFFEVLTQPAFSSQEVDRRRSEVAAEIKRSYDQPSWVASRVFSQFLYGPHPYSRSSDGSLRDVQTIRQADIVKYYLKTFRPNNADLVLVGDLRPGLLESLEKQLNEWQPHELEAVNYPPLVPLKGQQILLVDREDLKQSEVRLGHYGLKRKNDDYQAVILADVILSDGFNSRLMREIRVKRGLTYGIHTSFDALKDIGPFTVSSNTRHEKVGELVDQTIKVLTQFHDQGVTDAEVEEAKGYLRGTFPTRIETADELAGLLVALKFYGINESYLENYVTTLNKLTTADVNTVIKKYFHPDNMRVLVYGPKSQVLDQLRPLGAVEVKPYKELISGL